MLALVVFVPKPLLLSLAFMPMPHSRPCRRAAAATTATYCRHHYLTSEAVNADTAADAVFPAEDDLAVPSEADPARFRFEINMDIDADADIDGDVAGCASL